jgi:2-methylcitrate dehydratase PrpD
MQEKRSSRDANGPAAAAARERSLAEIIAAYVCGFDLAEAPPEVMERCRVAVIDTMGVMLAGSRQQVADIVCEMVADEASGPHSTIVGRSLRASPQLAALANGVAAHAMDYDFTFTRGQAVSAVIPALLPLAEARGATPAEFLAAFIVACEVAARLTRTSPQTSLAGWHAVGMVGAIAAAVGAARLLGVPASRLADVIGIGASLASGVSANFGTMTKPLHSGHAARNGVMAAWLGGRGLTASPRALEGTSGYFATFGRGLKVDAAPFDDLGRVYNLVEPGYKLKRYPCGGLSHAAIDAALTLHGILAGHETEIVSVDVGLPGAACQRIGGAYPQSIEGAKFSMPYLAAWTLLNGAPYAAAFTERAIADPRVKALAARVSRHPDPEFSDESEDASGRVRVTLADGRTFEEKVLHPSGSPQNPMSEAQIEAKFLDCAGEVMTADRARRLFAWLGRLPQQTSFAEFWPLIHAE